MNEEIESSCSAGQSPLIDQLLAQQDDVVRQLDELDARIQQVIASLTRPEQTQSNAA